MDDSICIGGACIADADAIDDAGCCYGDNILAFVLFGEIVRVKCSPGWNYCGWNVEANRYDCGTDGGEDPLGVHPRHCLANCVPHCEDRQCGPDGCGQPCGSCPDDTECSESGTCLMQPAEPVVEHVEAEPSDVRDTTQNEIVNPDLDQLGPSDMGEAGAPSAELDTPTSCGGCGTARSGVSTDPQHILMAISFLVILGFRVCGRVSRRRKA